MSRKLGILVDRAEFLGYLRQVPVAVHRVGQHVLVHLGIVGCERKAAPRAGHARLGVDDHVRLDDAGLHGGREPKYGRGWVAARVGDQVGRGHLVAVQLRQAVDGLLQVLGARVLDLVPGLVLVEVLQPEVRADVDRLDAALERLLEPRRACRVGQRREHHVDALGHLIRDGNVDLREVWEHLGKLLAGGAPSRDSGNLDFGMSVQDARELDSGVSRNVKYPDLHSVANLSAELGSVKYKAGRLVSQVKGARPTPVCSTGCRSWRTRDWRVVDKELAENVAN